MALLIHEGQVADDNMEQMAFEDLLACGMRQEVWDLEEEEQNVFMKDATRAVYRRRREAEQGRHRTVAKEMGLVQDAKDAQVFWKNVEAKAIEEIIRKTEIWLTTSEGKVVWQVMANEMYEEDPILASEKMQADPNDGNVMDCEWQQQLEAFGGQYALVRDTYCNEYHCLRMLYVGFFLQFSFLC